MTQAAIPLLVQPLDGSDLAVQIYNLTLQINAAGIGSAPMAVPPQIAPDIEVSLNNFILAFNDVTAPNTVVFLRGPIDNGDLQSELNTVILQINAFQSGGGGYTGPLDIVPGAVAAYGQRALSAAMRGSAIYTIREDSGDTTQSFDSDATTGEAPVAEITAFLNGANGFGVLQNDQSGNANNLDDGGIGGRLWTPNSIGTRPAFTTSALTFNGANTVLGGAFTIFCVAKFDTADGPKFCSFGGADPDAFTTFALTSFYNNEDEIYVTINNSAFWVTTVGIPLGVGTYIFEVLVAANGTVTIIANGTDLVATLQDGSLVAVPDMPNFLAAVGGSNPSAETDWLVWPGILSGPDRLAIRQNIANYYGITL